MAKKLIYTGTSGWIYKHWRGSFYPEGLKEDKLVFYAREFTTVELNYSFYRIPSPDVYEAWYKKTPYGFSFSIKMNRFITHIKRLVIDDQSQDRLRSFLKGTQGLKEKLAVILIQLHPATEADPERLKKFLTYYSGIVNELKYKPQTCIEFRNTSWFSDDIYQILKKFKVSLVFPSTEDLRKVVFTSGFAYIRIHGNKSYSNEELDSLYNEIINYPASVKTVYVYFNNDWNTYAIYNARYLISKTGTESGS